MKRIVFVLVLALTVTAVWSSRGTAKPAKTGPVLRILTATMLPDKRDQLSQTTAEVTQVLKTAKGVRWFKIGADQATGESVVVALWNNQAELDAFVNSDARKALVEKIGPLQQGEPSRKNYQVPKAKSAGRPLTTGHVLRVFSTTVASDKRDQMPKLVENISRTIGAAKGVRGFQLGSDATTGEIVVVSLWNSQEDIDAFVNSDARKAANEKNKPFMQGEPTAKNYQLVDAKH